MAQLLAGAVHLSLESSFSMEEEGMNVLALKRGPNVSVLYYARVLDKLW